MSDARPDEEYLRALAFRFFARIQPSLTPDEALTVYYFLPVDLRQVDGAIVRCRSSLEAVLRDTRRVVGRDDDGEVIDPTKSRAWIGAIGYLTVIDQLSKLLVVPEVAVPEKGRTDYERLLIWDGMAPDEAAAIYALRCAFVHSFGLINEPPPNTSVHRRQLLRHGFNLTAEGWELIRLGDRTDAATCKLADIRPTQLDLRTLADVVERLVRDLRQRHRAGTGLALGQDVDTVRLGCFFFHHPEVT